MTTRPHQIIVRVTPEANDKLRQLAKRYHVPVAAVARGMMQRGYQEWCDDAKLGMLK
jgi:LysM repeat protein